VEPDKQCALSKEEKGSLSKTMEEKGVLFRYKEGWEKGESMRVCPHLSKSSDVATLGKKSAFTRQPFPKYTHTHHA